MRCSQSDRVKEWREGCRSEEEKRTSLLFSSFSSSSLQSTPDRRSLIGNEPWSCSLSWDQQIATTYLIWRGDSSRPPLYFFITSLSQSLSFFFFCSSLSSALMGTLWFILGSDEVRAAETRGVFYYCRCVKYPTYSAPALPALTCQDWLTHLEWPCSVHCTDVPTSSCSLSYDRM